MRIIKTPSPNFSARPENISIDTIVLHYTGMKSTKEAIRRMCDASTEVSCHYCISEQGDIFQLVDDESKAWHAGKSFWRGRENINNYSIGIEIANNGHEWGYRPFEEEQIDSVISLCKNLIEKYEIKPFNIVGHSDIAPDRKEDPGEFFPWKLLADESIGLWHDVVIEDAEYSKEYDLSDKAVIEKIYKKLSVIGYKAGSPTEYDLYNKKSIIAFYRRFIPQRIQLCSNHRYPEIVKWDKISDLVADSVIEGIRDRLK